MSTSSTGTTPLAVAWSLGGLTGTLGLLAVGLDLSAPAGHREEQLAHRAGGRVRRL